MTSEATREQRLREIRAVGHEEGPWACDACWLLGEVARLEAALRMYGEHTYDCSYATDDTCDCKWEQWEAALAQDAQSVAGKEG